ncbi:unnamed protein product [Rhizophagus irregularis]|nr:unnamed protein product [Rhizophagus irregularis]
MSTDTHVLRAEFYKQIISLEVPFFEHTYCRLLYNKFICQQELRSKLYNKLFSGWIKSTLTNKTISILCLSWWDTCYQCRVCDKLLEFISHCQKWCQNCVIIYIGCRYYLTTNIIFGIRSKSQCRECGRESFITFKFNDDIINMEEFLEVTKINTNNHHNYSDLRLFLTSPKVYDFIHNKLASFFNTQIKWIPYFQIKNLAKIAEGGYGIIYSAALLGKIVAVKRLFNSQDITTYFINEVKSLAQCYGPYITKIHGVTRDPETKDYMLIMEYANGGNLHNYLQKNFTNISLGEKLYILWKITEGLNVIHKKKFIHRDLHSGNILLTYQSWLIGDLGLSQPANSTLLNNEIYGVIPYIAPEIFKGAKFSKESDIYSMGMIMWELTTGCKPFTDVEHDTKLIYEIIDGKRPEITNDTPECFANLMKECWNSEPLKRPSINQIIEISYNWYKNKLANQFKLAESKRVELIQMKELGPEFSKKPHSGAIFTSRSLASLISTTKLSLNNMKREYITEEHCLDINDIIQRISFDMKQEYISKEYELDINKNQCRPLNQLISTVNSSKKRNIEELEIEVRNDRNNWYGI